jgi:hypothetical protein
MCRTRLPPLLLGFHAGELIANCWVLEKVSEIVPKIEGAPDWKKIDVPAIPCVGLRPLA